MLQETSPSAHQGLPPPRPLPLLVCILREQSYVPMLFVDYSSAFNTIIPNILITKLVNLGLLLSAWIKDPHTCKAPDCGTWPTSLFHPHAEHYRCTSAKTDRLKNSFVPKAIFALKSHIHWQHSFAPQSKDFPQYTDYANYHHYGEMLHLHAIGLLHCKYIIQCNYFYICIQRHRTLHLNPKSFFCFYRSALALNLIVHVYSGNKQHSIIL